MTLRSTIRPWRLLVQTLYLLAAPGLGATNSPSQANNFWQAQRIYQIITDRFYDGDTNNDNAERTYAPGNPTGVHGGDFKGIEQKLDYIKALGATAIWILPIVLNTEGQFHGYSAWNFTGFMSALGARRLRYSSNRPVHGLSGYFQFTAGTTKILRN